MNNKEEIDNTFTEGLLSDLNPINTPNTVLTDNLNGTLITYNGNEYSLQNDMGNYKLKYCRLKPNYIPVGTKEYGDILYIVSYNPLDKHVEIGSYPSPQTISSSTDDSNSIDVKSILENAEATNNYTDLTKESELIVFYDGDSGDLCLYPGDKYKVVIKNKSSYNFETIGYYIVTEDKKIIEITDFVNQDLKKTSDENGFYNISWQNPGWMAFKYRLAYFDEFDMSVRGFTIPELSKSNFSSALKLNLQLKISDFLLLPGTLNESTLLNNIGVKIQISYGNTDIIDYVKFDASGSYMEWYDKNKILWMPYLKTLNNLNSDDNVEIKAIPFIIDQDKQIFYDNLSYTLNIPLNSIGRISDMSIGNKKYQFYINKAKTKEIVVFDISGPIVTNTELFAFYNIFTSNGKSIYSGSSLNQTYQSIPENSIGVGTSNQLQIPFLTTFEKETVYMIDFVLAPSRSDISNTSLSVHSFHYLITSEIFNDFVTTNSIFDEDISFDTWIAKYKDHISNLNDLNATFGTPVQKSILSIGTFGWDNDDFLNSYWSTNSNTSMSMFVPKTKYNLLKNKIFRRGYYYEVGSEINNNISLLKGNMWNGLVDGSTVNYNFYDLLGNSLCDTVTKSAGSPSIGTKTFSNLPIYLEETYEYADNSQDRSVIYDFASHKKSFPTTCPVFHIFALAHTEGGLWSTLSTKVYCLQTNSTTSAPFKSGDLLLTLKNREEYLVTKNILTSKILDSLANNPYVIVQVNLGNDNLASGYNSIVTGIPILTTDSDLIIDNQSVTITTVIDFIVFKNSSKTLQFVRLNGKNYSSVSANQTGTGTNYSTTIADTLTESSFITVSNWLSNICYVDENLSSISGRFKVPKLLSSSVNNGIEIYVNETFNFSNTWMLNGFDLLKPSGRTGYENYFKNNILSQTGLITNDTSISNSLFDGIVVSLPIFTNSAKSKTERIDLSSNEYPYSNHSSGELGMTSIETQINNLVSCATNQENNYDSDVVLKGISGQTTTKGLYYTDNTSKLIEDDNILSALKQSFINSTSKSINGLAIPQQGSLLKLLQRAVGQSWTTYVELGYESNTYIAGD